MQSTGLLSPPKKSLELKKHVAAIHSTNHLSLLQRKIANALLFNAYEDLLTKREHQIHIATLCDLICYDSHDHQRIKASLVALISTVIEWNLVDKTKNGDEGVWNASAILADASIDGPICSYSYSNRMQQLLHHPEMYGRLNMEVQSKFKSTYGLALYENCIRFQTIGQTPWFDLSTFRKLMGVEEGKYIIFRDFKRRVLEAAVDEVNLHAPITVTTQLKKNGRTVVGLKFVIASSNQENNATTAPHIELTQRDQLLQQFGLSEQQVQEIHARYEEPYIHEKIRMIEQSASYLAGKINNLAKYLLDALEQNYQPAKSSRENLTKKTVNKQRRDEQIHAYRRYQDQCILTLFADLPAKQKQSLEKEFAEQIKDNIYSGIFKKQGLSNVLIADKFCDFIRAMHKPILSEILNFETFCAEAHKSQEVL